MTPPIYRGTFRKERIIVGFLCDTNLINQDGIIYQVENVQQFVKKDIYDKDVYTGDKVLLDGEELTVNYNAKLMQFCAGDKPIYRYTSIILL